MPTIFLAIYLENLGINLKKKMEKNVLKSRNKLEEKMGKKLLKI